MTHTKSPWTLGTHPANHKLNIVKPVLYGRNVTVLPECEGGHVSINNIDDARLIAAAPELLKLAEERLAWLEEEISNCTDAGARHDDYDAELLEYRAAIAKARGQS